MLRSRSTGIVLAITVATAAPAAAQPAPPGGYMVQPRLRNAGEGATADLRMLVAVTWLPDAPAGFMFEGSGGVGGWVSPALVLSVRGLLAVAVAGGASSGTGEPVNVVRLGIGGEARRMLGPRLYAAGELDVIRRERREAGAATYATYPSVTARLGALWPAVKGLIGGSLIATLDDPFGDPAPVLGATLDLVWP